LFTTGPWSAINGQYAEDNNTELWGLLPSGAATVVHWRTDNNSQKVVFLPYDGRPDGRFLPAPSWSQITGQYAEDNNTGPWGLLPLDASVVHWRTDNNRQSVFFIPYDRQVDGRYLPVSSSSQISGQYAEDNNTGPWGLLPLGVRTVVHWRTDDNRQKVVFVPYDRQVDGRFLPGPWGSQIGGQYAENNNTGPWGLLPLGADTVVHWRTDNNKQNVVFISYDRHVHGRFLPGLSWSQISGQYAEDNNTGPWGLLPLGSSTLVHWRTDNNRQNVVFIPYDRQPDGRFLPGASWTQIGGQYADDNNMGPWGLLPLGANSVVHLRTDNGRTVAVFRPYVRKN
jgi:hypothetical protein